MTDNSIPAPAVETPVAAPAEPDQTVVEAPVPAPAPAAETPLAASVEAPVEAPVPAPDAAKAAPDTLLGKSPEAPAPVVEPVADATQLVTEGGQTEQAPPPSESQATPPSYDPWTLPEGVTLDDSRVGEFTNILAELETSGKVAHDLVQQFGQKAVDFHIAEVTRVTQDIVKSMQDGWKKQVSDWQDQVRNDPDIGGNRLDATIEAAQNFISTHGGTPEQQAEIRALMESSGLGNHPVLIRLFAQAGRGMSEGKPLAAAKPPAVNKSRVKTMYG